MVDVDGWKLLFNSCLSSLKFIKINKLKPLFLNLYTL